MLCSFFQHHCVEGGRDAWLPGPSFSTGHCFTPGMLAVQPDLYAGVSALHALLFFLHYAWILSFILFPIAYLFNIACLIPTPLLNLSRYLLSSQKLLFMPCAAPCCSCIIRWMCFCDRIVSFYVLSPPLLPCMPLEIGDYMAHYHSAWQIRRNE